MKLRFWGTRGSLAKPGPDTVRYGGNTSCVEVTSSRGTRLVIDCGTGGHELGRAIMAEGKPSRGHMLISHTHWDHIQGIPFFAPFFVPGHAWDLYAPQGFGESLRETLAGQMEYTYFPVTPEAFGARVRYNNLGEGSFAIEDVTIHTRYLNHPALALAFRIEADGASFVYSCDHEPHDAGAACGTVPLADEDLAHAAFMAGADLIVHDAQYLAHEYAAKRGWGHSTIDYAAAVARTARVPKVVLTHHDPIRTDTMIDAAVSDLRAVAGDGVDIIAAAEGMEITLGSATDATAPADHAKVAGDAIRQGPAAGVPRVLLIARDADIAARIARSLEDEPIALTRVCGLADAVEAGDLAHAGLVLVESGITSPQAIAAAIDDAGVNDTPVVLLGGEGPTGDVAVDRLDEPWSCEYARTRIRTWLMRAECHWAPAAIPHDEAERLAALHALRLLDTPAEERFDRLTRLAAGLFRTPVALISLVDADRQWFKSAAGTDMCETTRESSFCAHAVVAREMLIVPDALADDRFSDNPLVTGPPHIRFYAGTPIHAPGGQPIGTLCILDEKPRDLSPTERGLFADFALTVEAELARPA